MRKGSENIGRFAASIYPILLLLLGWTIMLLGGMVIMLAMVGGLSPAESVPKVIPIVVLPGLVLVILSFFTAREQVWAIIISSALVFSYWLFFWSIIPSDNKAVLVPWLGIPIIFGLVSGAAVYGLISQDSAAVPYPLTCWERIGEVARQIYSGLLLMMGWAVVFGGGVSIFQSQYAQDRPVRVLFFALLQGLLFIISSYFVTKQHVWAITLGPLLVFLYELWATLWLLFCSARIRIWWSGMELYDDVEKLPIGPLVPIWTLLPIPLVLALLAALALVARREIRSRAGADF